jgi:putative oxidoreductase
MVDFLLPLLAFSDWSLFLLRVVFAVIFLAHGWPKLKNLKATQENFGMMGFQPGWLWGTIVAVLEPLGGLLILLGIWTQLFALLLAVQMIVAALWKISKKQGLAGGYELDLLLVAAGLILATMGGGVLALNFF